MSKTKNPPKAASLTEELRWYLKNCGTTPHEVARATGIYHSSLYRFLDGSRGLSDAARDTLAKHLKLRLVRSPK